MWVPIKEAASHFGVGERAIRIACERGSKKYRFQKVKGIGGRGEVYEIWMGENDGQKYEGRHTDGGGNLDDVQKTHENTKKHFGQY